jgi:hypothetical protein
MSPASPPLYYQRCDSPTRGRHLRATAPIHKGRLLWVERPLLCWQTRSNIREAYVCSCCFAFLGDDHVALTRRFATTNDGNVEQEETSAISENHDENPNALLHCSKLNTSDHHPSHCSAHASTNNIIVPCRQACGFSYCSQHCEASAWELHHKVLCTGACESLADPLVEFKAWAMQTNEILLLVVEWWVAEQTTLRLRRMEDAKSAADDNETGESGTQSLSNPYQDFCDQAWWDVETQALRQKPGGFVEAAALESSLRSLCEEAAECFNRALEAYNNTQSSIDTAIPFMTALDVGQRVGACAQNAMGVRQRHPLCRNVLVDADLRERRHLEIVRALEDAGFIGDNNNNNNDCCEEEDVEDDEAADDDDDGAEIDAGEDNDEQVPASTDGLEQGQLQSAGDDEQWDYSKDDIAAFLSTLFIDEDGSVRDTQDGDDALQRDTTGDDLDYIFPPLDGTAMYALTCKMNHSCDPNVIVLYKRTDYGSQHPLAVFVVALKAIAAGEELTISYIDKSDGYTSRQEALQNYGFACSCSKCELERTGQMEFVSAEDIGVTDDDLFGGDDSASEEAIDEHETKASVDDGGGKEALRRVCERLETRANHCQLGSVPIQEAALAASFAVERATAVSSCIDDTTIVQLLSTLVDAFQAKDFCLCKIVGDDLEGLLWYQLRKDGAWPIVAYREAYWCSVVFAAIGYAHECSFLVALHLLDKGMILGLPRDDARLERLCCYIESHAAQLAVSPATICRQLSTNLDFRAPPSSDAIQQSGLSSPLRFPAAELNWEGMSFDRFREKFVSVEVPVVMRQFASHWEAARKWASLQWLSQLHGHRLVPVEIGSMLDGTMREELMGLCCFVSDFLLEETQGKIWSLDDAVNPSSRVAYMAQHPLLSQIQSLQTDLDPSPAVLGPNRPTHIYVWIGTGGTRTPLHYDSYDNLLVQLVGVKYVRLYNRSETPKLSIATTSNKKSSAHALQGNMSDVDCEREDFTQHHLAKSAVYTEVLLLPGDCVFIPSGTWHYVRSLSTSISINYWF